MEIPISAGKKPKDGRRVEMGKKRRPNWRWVSAVWLLMQKSNISEREPRRKESRYLSLSHHLLPSYSSGSLGPDSSSVATYHSHQQACQLGIAKLEFSQKSG